MSLVERHEILRKAHKKYYYQHEGVWPYETGNLEQIRRNGYRPHGINGEHVNWYRVTGFPITEPLPADLANLLLLELEEGESGLYDPL